MIQLVAAMKIVLLLMCVALGSGNHVVKRSNEFDDAYDYSEAGIWINEL